MRRFDLRGACTHASICSHQAMTKRPADSWPVWCAKSRLEYMHKLDIAEEDACQMMGEDAPAHSRTLRGDVAALIKVMPDAINRFVQRANDAASISEILMAHTIVASSAKDGDKTIESCGKECRMPSAHVSQTCKAQTRACKAAEKASAALKELVDASEAAHVCHSRFRAALESAQKNAACNFDSELRYKDAERFELAPGLCGVNTSPPMVGDISGGARFFVRIISADSAYASWSGGFVVVLEVNENDTIEEVKAKLQDKCGIPSEKLRLCHKGRKLRNGTTLQSHGIVDDDKTDWMVVGMLAASS